MDAALSTSFSAHHRILLGIHTTARTAGSKKERQAAVEAMAGLRDQIARSACAASIMSYETYLDLLCLLLRDPELKQRLTLLDAAAFEAALRNDPARADLLIGAALSHLYRKDFGRSRQLLTRLAASRYPEHRLAQILLRQTAAKAAQA